MGSAGGLGVSAAGEKQIFDVQLSSEKFAEIFADAEVKSLMLDIDVTFLGKDSVFDIFDFNRDGNVPLTTFLPVIMKLRGEPLKSDVVGSNAIIESLIIRFKEHEAATVKINKEMLAMQGRILAALGTVEAQGRRFAA